MCKDLTQFLTIVTSVSNTKPGEEATTNDTILPTEKDFELLKEYLEKKYLKIQQIWNPFSFSK